MRVPLFGVVGLALRRLRNRLALTALSLLGVILAVGLVSSVPVFAQAVSFLVLRGELSERTSQMNRPALLMRLYYETRIHPFTLADTRTMEDTFARTLADKLGVAPKQRIMYVESPLVFLRSAPGGPQYQAQDEKLVFRGFTLTVLGGVDKEMRIVEGEPFAGAASGDRLPVWPHRELCDDMGLQVGEPYDLYPLSSDQPIGAYIAGIWTEADKSDPYWRSVSFSRSGLFLVRPEDYQTVVEPSFTEKTAFSAWYFINDDSALTLDRINGFANGLEILPVVADSILPTTKIDVSPVDTVQKYVTRRDGLNDLLINFGLPAFGLLFYFLMLLSTVIVQFQREETAIMAGRGAGALFLVGLATVETLIIIVVGTPLGLACGWLMVRLMGQTSGFLSFVERPGFPASLNGVDVRLLAAALIVLMLARVAPTFAAARRSVVTHLRERGRQVTVSAAAKVAVDIPLIALTAYAYRQLRTQDVPTLIRIDSTADFLQDPLLLLAPLLCVFTAALVLSHIFPLIMRPLDALSRRLPWVSLYVGIRRLYGQSGQYTNALFLVIICLSLGAFYSSMALSVDRWMHDRQYYAVGSDFRFVQGVEQNAAPEGRGATQTAGAWVLPISDYLELPGVLAATRVGDFTARVAVPRNAALKVRFVGIDRLSFPDVAFYRDDFSAAPLGDLMNRLGRVRNGVLVSRRALEQYNILEGQKLNVEVTVETAAQSIEFVVVGVYDLFPTVYSRSAEALIGNIDYLFEQTGDPSLYSIWLKTAPDLKGEALMKSIESMGVLPLATYDTRDLLRKDSELSERIGIFGVLSVGFIAGSVLSWLGLLVYTSASMQGRLQQIGVLKAIGVQTRQTLLMEGVEYSGVILYGVLGGILSGVLVSYMFVPFFQFNVTAATAVPPFLPFIDWGRIAWFAVIFAGALLLSEVAILYQTTRNDIFQALRMGQRE